MMVSIIVPSLNKSKILGRCLDHIFKYTSQAKTPFEVVVVDDGSTEDFKPLKEKYDIKLVRTNWSELSVAQTTLATSMPEPKGFPSACNVGVRHAMGDFVCLLNNDCFVTEGWLEALLRVLRSDNTLAAVGPHANNVSGSQGVQVDIKNPQQLEMLVKKFQAQEKYVDRLIFFCTLIRRDVWEKLGGLDEAFNPGNFEDNYFCYLARKEGYRLKTVSHFVWHEGGSTFGYNQSPEHMNNYTKLLGKNQKIYHQKVGDYKKISLCMIVGDYEEPQTLKRALNSIMPFMDELNIVFNYKGFPKPWKVKKLKEVIEADWKFNCSYVKFSTFADLRNLSLSMAHTDYFLWIDTDDVCLNGMAFREAISEFPKAAYFKCRIISRNPKNRGADLILHNRLVKNLPIYRFRNSVHEDISFSLIKDEAEGVLTDIRIEHLGYLDDKLQEKKNLRNLKLIEKDIKEGNAHSLTYYHLVNSLILLRTFKARERAVRECDTCFELFNLKPEDPLLSKMWVLRGLACMINGQVAAAKQSFIKALIARPDHPEAKLNMGCILFDEGKIEEALAYLEEMWEKKQFNVGTNMAYNFQDIESILLKTLGDCYFKQNQAEIEKKKDADPKRIGQLFQKSEEFYRLSLSINPRNLEVADRLVQILRNTKRLQEANLLTVGIVNVFPGYFTGWFNLAQTELFEKRYETARVFLEKTLEIKPGYEPAMHNMKILNQMRAAA